MNFATVDPGAATGLAVWSDALTDGPHPVCWTLLHVGTLKYVGARDYLDKIAATIRNYRLEFAVIERYVNFGRRFVNSERMITQQTLLCEAFVDVVLIGKMSWDPMRTRPAMQAEIIRDYGLAAPKNEHERDAVNMGINIFRRLPAANTDKAELLRAAAVGEHNIKLVA